MNDIMLGHTPDSTGERDAIHVAIVSTTAAQDLIPGQRVGFVENGGMAKAITQGMTIGIVDPFLIAPIKTGDKFWMLLLPGTVTGMRHHWTHPEFLKREQIEPEGNDEKAKQAVMELAAICGKTYEALMDDADMFSGGDNEWDGWIMDNSERYKDVPEEMWEMFWAYYKHTTGQPGPADNDCPYTCSC